MFTVYNLYMIKSFVHKGLSDFFKTGSKAGIQPKHADKLTLLLSALDAATKPSDMNAPRWSMHQLTGDLIGHYSLKVNGNWRITFMFEGEDVVLVDYQDYH